MYTVVLESGLNVVELEYHTRFLMPGALCTGLGLCLTALIYLHNRRKNKKIM